jgi:hypothetical protein
MSTHSSFAAVTSIFLVGLGACAEADLRDAVDAGTQKSNDHGGPSNDAGLTDGGSAPTGDSGASSGCSASGVLATWTFTSETGSQASTAVTSTAPGVTGGDFTRGPGLVAISGAGSINSSKWSTATQLDETTYYTVTIAPPSGCALTLTGIAIDASSSATGPTMAAVGTDADGFAGTSPVGTTTPTTATLSVAGSTGPVEIRIFGYGATTANGTMRVQSSFTVSGMLQ